MKKKIVIYASKTCQYCDQVKKSLTESSIEFTEIDIIELSGGQFNAGTILKVWGHD